MNEKNTNSENEHIDQEGTDLESTELGSEQTESESENTPVLPQEGIKDEQDPQKDTVKEEPYLPKDQPDVVPSSHESSYKEDTFSSQTVVPDEIKGWNWGAFAFNIFWGIGNKTYLPLLCLIPIFNIVWIFVCGFKGNEWAWESGSFKSVEEFKAVQATWKRAGLVQAILMIVGFVMSILGLIALIIFGVTMGSILDDSYYNNYDDYDYSYNYDYDEVTPEASISDIGDWTQTIYDSISLATEDIDSETNVATYKDGTSYEALIALVGDPEDTVRDGNTIEATWWSDSYEYIEVNYDVTSGLIIDKYCSI